jgi:hypothetical protein
MNTLPELAPGRFSLLIVPHAAAQAFLELAAHLAWRGPLRVLDGGNCFNAYRVAGLLRQRTTRVRPALTRIRVARAFTCYQALALLQTSPEGPTPTLVLDLLSTFYDENVQLEERRRLLEASAAELHRLGRRAPVGVGVRLPGKEIPGQAELLDLLETFAGPVWRFEAQTPEPPLRLF